jgi:hypothetical protein
MILCSVHKLTIPGGVCVTRSIIGASALVVALAAAGFALQGTGDLLPAHPVQVVRDTTRHDDAASVIEHELTELRAKIAGHEKQPANEVFKNIQLFKNMEAGRLPGVTAISSRRS